MSERARRYLLNALNGDRDAIDAAVRRGLVSNAESIDMLRHEMLEDITMVRHDIQSTKRVIVGTCSATVVTVISAALTIILR